MTTSEVGYTLIIVGLSITLFAMALDEWTSLRELELITGCVGLIVSVIAAIIAACDLTGSREQRHELSRSIPDPAWSAGEARGLRPRNGG